MSRFLLWLSWIGAVSSIGGAVWGLERLMIWAGTVAMAAAIGRLLWVISGGSDGGSAAPWAGDMW